MSDENPLNPVVGGSSAAQASAPDTADAPETPKVSGVDPRFAAGSSCSVKPHKPYRDTNGQIHLTRLTEKGG